MIVADTANEGDAAVFLTERVSSEQLGDVHFAAQLVERLKWAGADAERAAASREPHIARPRPNPQGQQAGYSRV